ncbi:Hypothetical predicted protein, partial [Paramuricea clavata]
MEYNASILYITYFITYKSVDFLSTCEKLPDLCTGSTTIKVDKNPVTHEDLDKYDQGIKDGTGICDDTVDPPKISVSDCSIYQACIDGLQANTMLNDNIVNYLIGETLCNFPV